MAEKPRRHRKYSDIREERLDTVAARHWLVVAAKKVADEEDDALRTEGLHIGSSDDKVASYRGVGLGLYLKLLHWLIWMMIWMMICSIPYLIVINTSVFTDYAHREDHDFGVKVFESFELSSFTFAAILDDRKDNGTLQYMNTDIAEAWKGPMTKGNFLTWISLLDGGATVVLTAIVVVLFFVVDRWLRLVDQKTREVSDYSVIVGGLPLTVTAAEIGSFFTWHFCKDPRVDKVMDVVMIRGFNTIVNACKTIHKFEQLKGFVYNMGSHEGKPDEAPTPKRMHQETSSPTTPASPKSPTTPRDPEVGSPHRENFTVDMSREMKKVESKIREQLIRVEKRVKEGTLPVHAAIVTFNTERMRANVCKSMPSGWWSANTWKRGYRLQHRGQQWRLWVKRSVAPDDYRFENLSTRIRSNMCIQVFTGAVMALFIIVCAAFITWLSSTSDKAVRQPKWAMEELLPNIKLAMNATTALNSTNSTMAATDLAAYDQFCSNEMPTCNRLVNQKFPVAGLNMNFGKEWTFPNSTIRLLNERLVRSDMQGCAQDPSSCNYNYCLPCYCMGFRGDNVDFMNASADFLSHVKDTCSNYMVSFDVKRDGIKVSISVAIAVINAVLTYLLRVLKFNVERHWTTTDTELSFAVWSYIVRLINSVAVLLVVNCSTLRDLQQQAVQHVQWLKDFLLNGLYDDFSPDWYNSVGFSVMILMMINLVAPFLRYLTDFVLKWLQRFLLLTLHCGKLSAPEDYNSAFRNIQFTLEIRIADVLFNVTLALLFGSGMPLCYLIAAAYLIVCLVWDRANLLSMRQPSQRYSKNLPRFIMTMLPFLLAAHCAFGLWMHTYFRAEVNNMDLVAAASQGLDKPGINSLSENSLGRRITQPNGLALLIWFVTLAVWIVFGRWIIWTTLKCLGRSCARMSDFFVARVNAMPEITYEDALSTVKVAAMLRGARTYRIHHLAEYRPFLSEGAAGQLWAMAQGHEVFTRLTSFRIHVEMEVGDGKRRRLEQREVEMFDVSEVPITARKGSKVIVGSKPHKTAVASAIALTATATAAAVDPATTDADEPISTESAIESDTPSAALQAIMLQQIATLQANTGALVKRVSMRLAHLPTLHEQLPPEFQLDLQPLSNGPVGPMPSMRESAVALAMPPLAAVETVVSCQESGDMMALPPPPMVVKDRLEGGVPGSEPMVPNRLGRTAVSSPAASSRSFAASTRSAPAGGAVARNAAAGVQISAVELVVPVVEPLCEEPLTASEHAEEQEPVATVPTSFEADVRDVKLDSPAPASLVRHSEGGAESCTPELAGNMTTSTAPVSEAPMAAGGSRGSAGGSDSSRVSVYPDSLVMGPSAPSSGGASSSSRTGSAGGASGYKGNSSVLPLPEQEEDVEECDDEVPTATAMVGVSAGGAAGQSLDERPILVRGMSTKFGVGAVAGSSARGGVKEPTSLKSRVSGRSKVAAAETPAPAPVSGGRGAPAWRPSTKLDK